MVQRNWQKVTEAWVAWIKEPCGSLQDVMQMEGGGFFAEESAWIEMMESFDPMMWDEVFSWMEPSFPEGDLYKASRAALFCGSFVERGADPDLLVDVVVDLCESCLIQALQFVADVEERWDLESPDDLPKEVMEQFWEESPEWVKGWYALRFVILPVMTMLARSVRARQRARQKQSLLSVVDAMDEVHGLVSYLAELLFMVDDRECLVLHPKEKQGFRIKMNAIRNNYHLFTLLQQTLLLGEEGAYLKGELPEPGLGAVARGEEALERPMDDHGVWRFYHWTRLAKSASGSTDSNEHGIPGEGSSEMIRVCRGIPVIVLETAREPYTWSANFFAPLHDALRSRVEILEILSPAQVHEWLDFCGEQVWEPHAEGEGGQDEGQATPSSFDA